MHDPIDFELEQEFERPRKARKQQTKKAADKYYSDDGYADAKKNNFKQRRQGYK